MARIPSPTEFAAGEAERLRAENDRLQRQVHRDAVVRQELKGLRSRVADLELSLEAALALQPPVECIRLKPTASTATNEATAFLIASDWHVEELVEAVKVNGLNHYDLDESRRRAALFFTNGARLIHILRRDIAIPHIVVAVLGDMISNSIHEDLAESNLLPPIDAAMRCAEYLTSGLTYLLAETKAHGATIHVPCHTGNHGRTTKERRVSTEAGYSLERMIYALVAKHFRGEPRITFSVSLGPLSYVDAYGHIVRFCHGHQIRYQGGLAGLFAPAYRTIGRWDKGRTAHLTVFGHHHTKLDGGTFLANGSLIGYGPFSMHGGYAFEEPSQQFFLMDKRRGRTVSAPIWFDVQVPT